MKLAHRLADNGVPAQHVGHLTYDFTTGAPGELHVRVPRPGTPTLSIDGTVGNPVPAGPFVANWWSGTVAGAIKMSTSVPAIAIGDANLVLTTNPGGPLGQLIGGAVHRLSARSAVQRVHRRAHGRDARAVSTTRTHSNPCSTAIRSL